MLPMGFGINKKYKGILCSIGHVPYQLTKLCNPKFVWNSRLSLGIINYPSFFVFWYFFGWNVKYERGEWLKLSPDRGLDIGFDLLRTLNFTNLHFKKDFSSICISCVCVWGGVTAVHRAVKHFYNNLLQRY